MRRAELRHSPQDTVFSLARIRRRGVTPLAAPSDHEQRTGLHFSSERGWPLASGKTVAGVFIRLPATARVFRDGGCAGSTRRRGASIELWLGLRIPAWPLPWARSRLHVLRRESQRREAERRRGTQAERDRTSSNTNRNPQSALRGFVQYRVAVQHSFKTGRRREAFPTAIDFDPSVAGSRTICKRVLRLA